MFSYLHCLQIKQIEVELRQLTKLELKRRTVDAEILQVGITTLFFAWSNVFVFCLLIAVGFTSSFFSSKIFV